METLSLHGPDGLRVTAVPLGWTYGVWAKWAGVRGPAALLVTRRGAYAGLYPDADELAEHIDLNQLIG